jgi:RNA polymerase sigma-70 factor (ECF subfamily)
MRYYISMFIIRLETALVLSAHEQFPNYGMLLPARGKHMGRGHPPAAMEGGHVSQTSGSPLSTELRDSLLKALPNLRAFAISLTGNIDQADDLVQEAITRALTSIHHFEPGTNMRAWLFTILRNQFHTTCRKHRREIEDPDGVMAGMLSTPPEQHGHLDLDDLRTALAKLPAHHREAILLIGAEGLSYEEAAQVCGTHIGTIKSRMNRARIRLAELLRFDDEDDFGADPVLRAALTVENTRVVA